MAVLQGAEALSLQCSGSCLYRREDAKTVAGEPPAVRSWISWVQEYFPRLQEVFSATVSPLVTHMRAGSLLNAHENLVATRSTYEYNTPTPSHTNKKSGLVITLC